MTDLDAQRTAVVLIDLMPRLLELDLHPRGGPAVLDAALALAEGARSAGAPVIAVRVERPNVAEQPPGSGLEASVAKVADAVVVKRSIGGFHGTDLDAVLREHGAEQIVIAGIATNLGVESTARGAADRGYDLVFAEDAMSAFTEAEHEAAVTLDFPRFGEVARTGELVWG